MNSCHLKIKYSIRFRLESYSLIYKKIKLAKTKEISFFFLSILWSIQKAYYFQSNK